MPEMNYLEVDFLFGVGFDLNVSPETFGNYCAILQSEMLCLELEPVLPAPAASGSRLLHCCISEDDGTDTSTSSSGGSSSSSCQQQLAA